MKNTFGNSVSFTLIGESHGKYVGGVLDGIAPGIRVDEEYIKLQLWRRCPKSSISTKRIETDKYEIISGVYKGFTTGAPLSIIIPNSDTSSKDYEDLLGKARPGHADYTVYKKYHGFNDGRGGGHFSGRLTAAMVALGAICELALKQCNILIGTHIYYLGGIYDRNFENLNQDLCVLNQTGFPVLEPIVKRKMKEQIQKIAQQGDSLGGITQTAIINLPAGLGEPAFDSFEGMISHILFGIPAVKGVSFGIGFSFAECTGSSANDYFFLSEGKVQTKTNNNGGINGGITNGMPVIFNTVVKPTPSIFMEQTTIDFIQNKNQVIKIKGRHDPAVVHRVAPVIDAATAIVVCDLMAQRYGTDFCLN